MTHMPNFEGIYTNIGEKVVIEDERPQKTQ